MQIQKSELLLNPDGSIYHLNLFPQDIADDIILVGDPGRVQLVASFFDSIELQKNKREFFTVTGRYKGKRITVLSTGIGTDNIDIVVNELDALVNIDLETRTIKKQKRSLNLIRVGTTGGLQAFCKPGCFVISESSIGFDGMLNFYKDADKVSQLDFEKAFMSFVNWNPRLTTPYCIDASDKLVRLFNDDFIRGITIASNGFYGPQGRELRLKVWDSNLNNKIEKFEFEGRKITNYEMESSALYGLSKLLNHNALTVCLVIANRVTKTALEDYHPQMKQLIEKVLDKVGNSK